ncbi:DUF4402 domain-containing protein [Roseateles sp. NT4]|uniref:DUF4402 domain-containing protein n=1 Tax=Roseateles sp. NT4 TaxID=3453715 RepID=UPI003EF02755
MKRRLPWALLLACTVASAQTLTNNVALSFGAFTAGSGGSITVAPGGGRMKTGSVILVNQAGTASAAQFTISGTPNAVFTISLPIDGSTFLTDGGSGSMALNSFSSSPSVTGVLSGGGTQTINVGATLSVGNLQGTGSYSGSFNVTVNYQ